MTTGRLAVAAITLDFGNTLVRVDRTGLRGRRRGHGRTALERRGIDRDRSRLPRGLGGGARPAVPRGGAALPRGRHPARARSASSRACAGMAAPRRRGPLGRRGRRGAGRLRPRSTPSSRRTARSFLDRMRPGRRTRERRSSGSRVEGSRWRSCRTGRSPRRSTASPRPRAGSATSGPSSSRSGSGRSSRIRRSSGPPRRRSGVDAADARPAILHVGDDWAADVVGASQAGWRTAYLRDRQHDTPLPTSERGAQLTGRGDRRRGSRDRRAVGARRARGSRARPRLPPDGGARPTASLVAVRRCRGGVGRRGAIGVLRGPAREPDGGVRGRERARAWRSG